MIWYDRDGRRIHRSEDQGTGGRPVYWANTTLRLLKLERKYRATIIPAKDNTLGMLKKVQHYIAWKRIDLSLAKELLDKKARMSGYRGSPRPTSRG